MKDNKNTYKDKDIIIITLFIFLIGFSFFFLLLLKDTPFSLSPTGKSIIKVNVTKAQVEKCDFPLYPGNNLISFHCLISLSDRDYVLESIEGNYSAIYGYNPNAIDSWISYNPNLPSYAVQDLTYIDNRRGYWLVMKDNSTFFHNGSVSNIETIPLSLNWNLIGYPRNESEDINVFLAEIQGNYTIIMTYNTSSGFWQSAGPLGLGTLENITPDKGYWIYMNASDQLNVTW